MKIVVEIGDSLAWVCFAGHGSSWWWSGECLIVWGWKWVWKSGRTYGPPGYECRTGSALKSDCWSFESLVASRSPWSVSDRPPTSPPCISRHSLLPVANCRTLLKTRCHCFSALFLYLSLGLGISFRQGSLSLVILWTVLSLDTLHSLTLLIPLFLFLILYFESDKLLVPTFNSGILFCFLFELYLLNDSLGY